MISWRTALAALVVLVVSGASFAPAAGRVLHVRLDQEGLPKEAYTEGPILNSATKGGGALTVDGPLTTSSYREQRASPRGSLTFEHVDTIAKEGVGAPEKHVTRLRLRAVNVRLVTFADGTRMLFFTALVVSSNDRACPVGSRGPMYVAAGPKGTDSVWMVLCPYAHEHYFESGLRGRLLVGIG